MRALPRWRTASPIAADDVPGLVDYAVDKDRRRSGRIVGPEVALVAGLVDAAGGKGYQGLRSERRRRACWRDPNPFMKDIVAKYGIPTAAYAQVS